MLFGTDLCVLGGTSHPVCWDALKRAWRQLEQKEREKVTEASTQAMLDRELVIARPSGRGVDALIRFSTDVITNWTDSPRSP